MMRGGVQVCDRMVGNADVGRRHTFFEAIAREQQLPGSPDFPHARLAIAQRSLLEASSVEFALYGLQDSRCRIFPIGIPLAAIKLNGNSRLGARGAPIHEAEQMATFLRCENGNVAGQGLRPVVRREHGLHARGRSRPEHWRVRPRSPRARWARARLKWTRPGVRNREDPRMARWKSAIASSFRPFRYARFRG